MLEGDHDYQFVYFIVKNKYSEKEISIFKFDTANKNKTETNFIRNFNQNNLYNPKKLAIKIENVMYNLQKLMRKSIKIVIETMEQLQLIYLTDLDCKKPMDMINKINQDLKTRGDTYRFKKGRPLIDCDHMYACKMSINNKSIKNDNIIFIFFKKDLETECHHLIIFRTKMKFQSSFVIKSIYL